MLQELCPRCGAELINMSRACPECGFDQTGPRSPADVGSGRGIRLGPTTLAVMGTATVAMLVVAFVAGLQVRPPVDSLAGAESPPAADAVEVTQVPGRGRVVFAERLGDGLELESYRTQFTRDDTIAWRAELAEPPPAGELTLVITWVSIRERMQLSESTVEITDPELPIIARDEVAVRDLVPTAGLYEVTYQAGDVKLAEGVFELLPPDR